MKEKKSTEFCVCAIFNGVVVELCALSNLVKSCMSSFLPLSYITITFIVKDSKIGVFLV